MTMEVTDSKGKVQFKQDKGTDKIQVTNYLGGNKLPAFAHVDIGLDMPAGEYTIKVGVTDLGVKGGKPAELSRKFEVLKAGFGIVRVTTSYDPDGQLPAPMLGVVGQLMTINFVVVGFERKEAKDKTLQPNFTVEMRILDEKGNPTVKKPISDRVPNDVLKAVPPNLKAIDLHFSLALNRPGNYTVELTVTDKNSSNSKPAVVKVPLTVLPPSK
jgi:hypothetical protein